jgi:adenosylcobinamide kinase/adenosylcobinamide-phosphate guanylyltransferase
MSVILILGGARSGKSHYAQELAAELGRRVLYVATAEALDDEMAARIEMHKNARPPAWRTLEARYDVAEAVKDEIGDAETVVIDCMTLLISNLAGGENPDIEVWEKRVADELDNLVALTKSTRVHFVIVSNEVGLGLVPNYPLGRAFRDIAGWANQMLARSADEVYFMLAGIPITLKKEGKSG